LRIHQSLDCFGPFRAVLVRDHSIYLVFNSASAPRDQLYFLTFI
jgi:hypothetical protein